MNKEKTELIFSLGELEYSATGEWMDYSQYGFDQDDATDLIALAIDKKLHFADDDDMWVPAHAWRILGQLASEEAVLPLIDIFDLITEQDDDFGMTDLVHVMAMIGMPAIVPLASFMNDKKHDQFARIMAIESLSEIVKRFPDSRRLQVLKIYQNYMAKPEIELPILNGLLISYVLEIDGKELLEDIRTLFKQECVDLSVVGDMEDVEIILGLRTERETPKPTFEEMHGISAEMMEGITPEKIIELFSDKEPIKPTDKNDVLAWLDYYFMLYGNNESILDASELDGFCASLACSPEMILPSTWNPAIWGGEELMPEWETINEATNFSEFLFTVYNHAITQLNDGKYEPLFWLDEVDDETYSIADEWCSGFLRGVDLWGSLSATDTMVVEKALEPIRLFAAARGFKQLDNMSNNEVKIRQDLIEPSIKKLFDYFLEKRKELVAPIVRREAKTSRNEPCPCGSGKKYKKCCLH
ncbi:MAG: hypothetical protein COA83_04670 [Methylophaga sp.]|nr:MAG: hypothetical protein COA83_04670 [Methylophaga sp.]